MPQEPQTVPRRKPARLLKAVELGLSVILIFLLGAYLLRFRLQGDGEPALSVRMGDLTVTEVRLGPMREFLPVESTVLPLNTVYLDASEGGRVEKIFVEVGTVVKAGDPILQLANTNLLMDVMNREAELFQQSNNLRNTRLAMEQFKLELNQKLTELDNQILQQKRLYDRYKELDKDNLISKQEYEQARDQYEFLLKRKELAEKSQKSELALRTSQLESLEQSLLRMETNLEAVKQKQDNLTIKAPIAGQITNLEAEIGQTKTPGQRLGQIDVLNGFKALAAIEESYLSRIDVRTAGEFDYQGHTFALRVRKVFPEVKGGKFQVELEFRGDRPKGIVRGQTLHARIALGEISKALQLPTGEYLRASGGDWVYRIDPQVKTAIRQSIRIGRQNADAVEIVKGLKSGDRVITSSYAAFNGRDKLLLKDR